MPKPIHENIGRYATST